jgi:Kef-type K+ transport system membrane component KefB
MHNASPLISIVIVLTAALISASILLRLKQPTIIGFILAGILIGPSALQLVPYENVELLAELGIGLLMFTIGAELSIQQLLRVKYVATLRLSPLRSCSRRSFIGPHRKPSSGGSPSASLLRWWS